MPISSASQRMRHKARRGGPWRLAAATLAALVYPAIALQTPANANPPVPQGSWKVDAAVEKADSLVGTDEGGEYGCGALVASAYGVRGIGYNTALEFRNALDRQGKIHLDSDFPKGALVFSESRWSVIDGRQYGHVDIARGDGTFVSGGLLPSVHGLAGAGHHVQLLSSWNPAHEATYLGWADAPW